MKSGDLVSLKMKTTQPPQIPRHGIIVETWKNHYHKLVQIEVLWEDGNISKLRPDLFEVISEELTDDQLETVVGGMSPQSFEEWRCKVINEDR